MQKNNYRGVKITPKKKQKKSRKRLFILVFVIFGIYLYAHYGYQVTQLATTKKDLGSVISKNPITPSSGTTKSVKSNQIPPSTPPEKTECSSNTLDKLLIVSISNRKMWACNLTDVVYTSPVITGMSFLVADLTPTGTFHIYSKITNTVLRGSDSTGSWDDPVSYWMPFLNNQYGQYGFHDATWRNPNEFGNVSPDSKNASHGCVELPLDAAAWVYNWAPIGTQLNIVN
jgi:lipoprotein-anchoring transpeptidase ErfK/SrfK